MAGSSYSAYYLAQGLAANGHDVSVACKEGSFLEQLIKSSDLKRVSFSSTGKFNLFTARALSLFVKSHAIEVVNAQASSDRYVSIFARWLFGMPGKLIHTRRQKPETSGGKLKAWFYTRGTDKIIAVSPTIKEFLTRSGIPEGHIQAITNGIPRSKWENVDSIKVEGLRKKYGIKKGDLVVGCVSRIKKQEQILRAVARIDQPVKVILVGIADQYPHLTKIIKSLPPVHQVFFTGEISNLDALHHYPLFTVKILPSDMEGFSQSLLEAMSLGVPVIATNASGNPDLIEHGENGLLFEDDDIEVLAEVIKELVNNGILRKRLINKAQSNVRAERTMESVVSHYEDMFNRL